MYKLNTKEQSGAKSPKERRQLAKEFREAEKEAKAQVEKENVTFGEYFQEDYFPTSLVGKKKGTSRKEVEHFKNWIQPIIGKMPFKEIKPFTIEKIKKNILADGKSPRSLQYVFATIRQVWNMARRDGLISGDSPTKQVKIPKIDNKRIRFLSHEEADLLLEALKEDPLTHDLALLSLQTGLRVGEMAKLKWSHIDLDRGIIHVMDSKGGKGRVAYITKKLKTMLKARKRRGPNDHVFIRQDGELITDMPRIFFDVVNDLGFNNDITDSRQKVVAHTLRHTFASWHVEAGTDLYTLKTLMGHSVMAMTERYAHLSNGTLQNATANFEKANKASAKKAGQVVNFKK
jgi:site-specific recombinase XerD